MKGLNETPPSKCRVLTCAKRKAKIVPYHWLGGKNANVKLYNHKKNVSVAFFPFFVLTSGLLLSGFQLVHEKVTADFSRASHESVASFCAFSLSRQFLTIRNIILFMRVFVTPLNSTLGCKSHTRFVRPIIHTVYKSMSGPPIVHDLKVQFNEVHLKRKCSKVDYKVDHNLFQYKIRLSSAYKSSHLRLWCNYELLHLRLVFLCERRSVLQAVVSGITLKTILVWCDMIKQFTISWIC